MINLLHKIWQNFYYGTLGYVSDIDLSVIPQSISLKPHYDKLSDVYWVESAELPDFEATGKTLEELAIHIGDALLVYFDVPYYFARNYKDGIMTIPDPKTGNQESIHVSRKSFEKVLA